MENLQALVDRVQAEDAAGERGEALAELVLLSEVPANRAALFAHPQLVSLALNLFLFDDCFPALELLDNFAKDVSLQRQLYLQEGLVEAIIARCEEYSDEHEMSNGNAEWHEMETRLLERLLLKFENKLDFIRDGCASRLGEMVENCMVPTSQSSATFLLRDCVRYFRVTTDVED